MTSSVIVGNETSERLPPPARILPFSGMKPHVSIVILKKLLTKG